MSPWILDTRSTRRSMLSASAALLGGGLLAACGAPSASLTPSVPVTELTVSMDLPGGGNARELALINTYLDEHFSSTHRGLRVTPRIGPATSGANGTPAAPAIAIAPVVAGTGSDVLSGTGYQFPAFLEHDLLVPISPHIAASAIDLTEFDAGHLHVLNEPPGGLYGLPAYDAPDVVLVNLSLLQSLGLPVPEAQWTSESAEALWQKAAGLHGSERRWGMVFNVQEYFLHLFGGHLMNADGTLCLLDQAPVLQAANWLVELYQSGVVNVDTSGGTTSVLRGEAPFGMSSARNLSTVVTTMAASNTEWDLLPMPLFPHNARYTYNNGDWYGINALSTNPALAVWELFEFIVTDPGFAQFMFSVTLVPPNRQSLWDAWVHTVTAVAPILALKPIQYYVQAMAYGVCNRRFHTHPYECDNILQQWIIRMFLGTVSPDLALREATQAINALQTT